MTPFNMWLAGVSPGCRAKCIMLPTSTRSIYTQETRVHDSVDDMVSVMERRHQLQRTTFNSICLDAVFGLPFGS